MKFEKIHVFYRQTTHNKISPTRVPWFDYERCFKSFLDSLNPDLTKLTVCFDGFLDEYDNHFTSKYQNKYNFSTQIINTNSYTGPCYENNGSSKSSCLVAEIIKKDNLPENSLIFTLENDYIFQPIDWATIVLDLFNNHINENHIISLYDHLDKYIFTQDTNNHWGMYKDLKSKIILGGYNHWREVPNITSSWILSKKMFDMCWPELSQGISDNTGSDIWSKKFGTKYLSPIPSINCHSESYFIAPFVPWQQILENVVLL